MGDSIQAGDSVTYIGHQKAEIKAIVSWCNSLDSGVVCSDGSYRFVETRRLTKIDDEELFGYRGLVRGGLYKFRETSGAYSGLCILGVNWRENTVCFCYFDTLGSIPSMKDLTRFAISDGIQTCPLRDFFEAVNMKYVVELNDYGLNGRCLP
jgi:hypothetical protein